MSIEIKRSTLELASKVKGMMAGGAVAGITSVAGLDTLLLWVWNDLLHGLLTFLPTMTPQVAGILVTLVGAFIGGWATKDRIPEGSVANATGIGPNPVAINTEISTPSAQKQDAANV